MQDKTIDSNSVYQSLSTTLNPNSKSILFSKKELKNYQNELQRHKQQIQDQAKKQGLQLKFQGRKVKTFQDLDSVDNLRQTQYRDIKYEQGYFQRKSNSKGFRITYKQVNKKRDKEATRGCSLFTPIQVKRDKNKFNNTLYLYGSTDSLENLRKSNQISPKKVRNSSNLISTLSNEEIYERKRQIFQRDRILEQQKKEREANNILIQDQAKKDQKWIQQAKMTLSKQREEIQKNGIQKNNVTYKQYTQADFTILKKKFQANNFERNVLKNYD